MAEPLVSLCMPTYNGEKYIDEALRSALAQDFDAAELELVVSDSGSTDATLARVNAAAADSSFPVRVLDDRTPGMVRNWNAAVRGARGTWIKFLFQDDTLDSGCVKTMVAAARRSEGVGMVFCRRRLIIESAAEGGELTQALTDHENLDEGFGHLPPVQPGIRLLGNPWLLRGMQNKIGEPTVVLARRDLLLSAGLFNENMRQTVDLEMWLRLLLLCDVAFVAEQLAAFRVHAEQMSAVNAAAAIDRSDHREMMTFLSRRDVYAHLHPLARMTVRSQVTPPFNGTRSVVDRGFDVALRLVRLARRLGGVTPKVGPSPL